MTGTEKRNKQETILKAAKSDERTHSYQLLNTASVLSGVQRKKWLDPLSSSDRAPRSVLSGNIASSEADEALTNQASDFNILRWLFTPIFPLI